MKTFMSKKVKWRLSLAGIIASVASEVGISEEADKKEKKKLHLGITQD